MGFHSTLLKKKFFSEVKLLQKYFSSKYSWRWTFVSGEQLLKAGKVQ